MSTNRTPAQRLRILEAILATLMALGLMVMLLVGPHWPSLLGFLLFLGCGWALAHLPTLPKGPTRR